jgi:hypothetical protein
MPRKPRQCEWCSADAGPRLKMLCDYNAGYHAGHSARLMREKRAKSPEYRKAERKKVKSGEYHTLPGVSK